MDIVPPADSRALRSESLSADLCVIGGGMAGDNAAAVAWGMGAHVTVFDLNVNTLFFKKPFGLGDGDGKVAWPEIVRESQGRF